jgi:hypothetical protein
MEISRKSIAFIAFIANGPPLFKRRTVFESGASRAPTQDKQHKKDGNRNADEPQKDPANFARFMGAFH